MLNIGVITLFPEMLDALRCGGVTARAIERDIVRLQTWNPRDFTKNKHRRVDDRPYGGGPGMVMQVQPVRDCIRSAKQALGDNTHVVYLSPQGRRLDQAGLQELQQHAQLLLLCGRYEGIDERVLAHDIDAEWSIGDYVLSGGELGAMVMIDALARLQPDALGHEDSASEDSFATGWLDHPHYSRPEMIEGQSVPQVLLDGDHEKIRRWRLREALGRTWLRRPDLLEAQDLDTEQQALLADFIQNYK